MPIPPHVKRIIKKSKQGRFKQTSEFPKGMKKAKRKAKAQGQPFTKKARREATSAIEAEQEVRRAQR